MNRQQRILRGWVLMTACVLACALLGCGTRDASPPPDKEHSGASGTPSKRVDISAAVRQNLGITFAQVESRSVARTLRVPGRFELLPTAMREYRAAASGTVEVLVQQYQRVVAGTPLYRLDSARWREMQKELADAEASVKLAQAGVESIAPLLAAHENHHSEIQVAVDLWAARVTALEQLHTAGGARGDEVAQAKAALASSRSELAETLEKEADLLARKSETAAQLDAARSRLEFLFEAAATLAGVSTSELRAPTAQDTATPRWRTLGWIEVRAIAPGVVESVHAVSGSVIEQHAQVLSTVQPELVRFRAVGLQSDLAKLRDGQPASVIAAFAGSSVDRATNVGISDKPAVPYAGTLTLAPTADPERRTIELILTPAPESDTGGVIVAAPSWARAGVGAFLEVVTAGNAPDADHAADKQLAIPLRCVARDGTQAIIFRRDPADPDKAIRVEADLGIDDGRWVVIKSGVAEGNQIVLDGVYQLMVATSGSITKGGHFHPDGTFHEGEDK